MTDIDIKEYPFWIALANISGNTLRPAVKSRIIIKCCNDAGQPLSSFFESSEGQMANNYGLSDKEIAAVKDITVKLPNYSFLTEEMISQGYGMIPLFDKAYPKSIKNHLKMNSPVLLYVKGNKDLLKKDCTAVVGSRNAGEISLNFTDNIVRKAVEEGHPVVSGYAKGIDRQAYDSSLKYRGDSIIVLPQGIMTFNDFPKMYKALNEGRILVLSTFYPSARWSVSLAMARNPIIYAIADNIFVAESNDSGGTWAGVTDGLKKGRKIYIRMPSAEEKNANMLLIHNGCIPVSNEGEVLIDTPQLPAQKPIEEESAVAESIVAEPSAVYKDPPANDTAIKDEIIRLLHHNTQMDFQGIKNEIRQSLGIYWNDDKLRRFIKNSFPDISIEKRGCKNIYALKSMKSPTLF